MGLSKRDRLEIVYRRLTEDSPFASCLEARAALERIVREVEDRFSGVSENPDAHNGPTEGRMYPPHDQFEVTLPTAKVRTFRQFGHRTSFGSNGAIRIAFLNGTIVLDLPGADGGLIDSLVEIEVENEPT